MSWRPIRRLTPGERRLAIDGARLSLDLDPIRIVALPILKRAFVPGRLFGRDWIVWPAAKLPEDLSQAPLGRQATFVHELVHVWQGQNGVSLPIGKLKAGDGAGAYRYVADAACEWRGLNIEQQAMVIEHRFRLARGGTVPGDAAFYQRVCPR